MIPRIKRIWKTIAIVVALFAAAYIGLAIWSFVALHRAYAALARDGRPMTAAEAVPPPASPMRGCQP